MIGLSYVLSPWQFVKIEGEQALGWKEIRNGRASGAFSMKISTRYRSARLILETRKADDDFPGYFPATQTRNVHLSFPLLKQAQGQAFYRSLERRMPDLDSLTSMMYTEEQWQTTLSCNLPLRSYLTLDGDRTTRKSTWVNNVYDWDERTATVRLRFSPGRTSLTVNATRGLSLDRITQQRTTVAKYGAMLSRTLFSWLSCNANYQASTMNNSTAAPLSQTVGVSANLQQKCFTFSVSAQHSDVLQTTRYTQDQFMADFRYQLFRGHAVSVRSRKLDSREHFGMQGWSVLVAYEFSLGIPVAKRSNVGLVKGRVLDAESMASKGVVGAVVVLDGMAVVTDKQGRFLFSGVTPGQHYLQVDRGSIGLGRITLGQDPLNLTVRGGKSESVDVRVVRAATISGEVAIYGLEAGGSASGILVVTDTVQSESLEVPARYTRLQDLSNVQVELCSEREILRVTTDGRGRFQFKELSPGAWKLRILKSGIPLFHQPEIAEQIAELMPGENRNMDIRILPQKRPVIILDKGKTPVIQKDDLQNASRK
jgi:hypothetical protein